MSTTGRMRRRAAVRLVGLLAVVLGLLGMHGLASTHHAAAPAHLATTAADVAEPVPLRHQAQHRHAAPDAAAALLVGATTGPAVPTCDDDCPTSLAVLCAAVLVTAAAAAWLVAATAVSRVSTAAAHRGPRPRAPAGARLVLPERDPVAGLCVSRT